jgi:hypothetical protein
MPFRGPLVLSYPWMITLSTRIGVVRDDRELLRINTYVFTMDDASEAFDVTVDTLCRVAERESGQEWNEPIRLSRSMIWSWLYRTIRWERGRRLLESSNRPRSVIIPTSDVREAPFSAASQRGFQHMVPNSVVVESIDAASTKGAFLLE